MVQVGNGTHIRADASINVTMFGLEQGKEKFQTSPVQGMRWRPGITEEFKIGSPRRLTRLKKLAFQAEEDLLPDEVLVIEEVRVTSEGGEVSQKFFFHQAITAEQKQIVLLPSSNIF